MVKKICKRLFLLIFLQIFLLFSPLVYAGKLAIVIDDIGYKVKDDNDIFALPKEVSVAIIPVAPYAKTRAAEAYSQKRDILIHLPMEPKSKQPIEAGGIKIGDNEEKIRKLIEVARGQVPYAIGLNNHMGSGATSDSFTMLNLMKVLKENGLFFLDSKTIGSSVAAKTARQLGVNALERNIFLDDSDRLEDVQRQFASAITYARRNGVAIVIGHPRKNTISVLKQQLAQLPKDIELVGIGALWRNEKVVPEKPFIMLFEQEPALTSVPPYESIPLLRGIPK
ncbi:divergent polysaccharide deacetylase family protein [Mannheimia sp. AT1]|uniref:Divergent polysaccharide deacetylase family protein n=1 Tax=Mannheimia cairinae TaxID=3025936 RepID=A0ABT5MLP2_9PAST|nr:divergent polysaccharide deacetylase family protein [Mannheimia cairinae]MDD0823040.1 divergent polysaccharide deacetylase family protein [Mannheimia cairinae]MDD0825935.1 divergent polysaccharide deacetylase family protein [Mannheimia cairinae]